MATVIYKERRKSSIGQALRLAGDQIAKGIYAAKEREHQQEMQEDRQQHQFDYLKKQAELNLNNTMTGKRYEQTSKNIQSGRDALVYDFFATHTEDTKYGPRLSATSKTEWAKSSAALMAGASNDTRKFVEDRLGKFDETFQTEKVVADHKKAFAAMDGPTELAYMINENPESVKTTHDLYYGKGGMLSRGVDEVIARLTLGHLNIESLMKKDSLGSLQFQQATKDAAGGHGVPVAAVIKDPRFAPLANKHRWYKTQIGNVDRQLITAEGSERAELEQMRNIYVGMRSMSAEKEVVQGIIKEFKADFNQADIARFFTLKAKNEYIPRDLRDRLSKTAVGQGLVNTYIETQALDEKLIADAGDLEELKERMQSYNELETDWASDPLYMKVKQHSGAKNALATHSMARILLSEAALFAEHIAPEFPEDHHGKDTGGAFLAHAMQHYSGEGGAALLRSTYQDKFNLTVSGKLMAIFDNQIQGKTPDADDWKIIEGVFANQSLSHFIPIVKDILATAQDPFKTVTVGDTTVTAKQANLPAFIQANIKLGEFTNDNLSRNAAVQLTMNAMGQLDLKEIDKTKLMGALKGDALEAVTKLYQDSAATQLAIAEGKAAGVISEEDIASGTFNLASAEAIQQTIKTRKAKSESDANQAVFSMPSTGPLSKGQQRYLSLASADVQKAFWGKRTTASDLAEKRRYDDFIVNRDNAERLAVLTNLKLVNPAIKQSDVFLTALAKDATLAGTFVREALQEQTEDKVSFAAKTTAKWRLKLHDKLIKNFYDTTRSSKLDLTATTGANGEFTVTNNTTGKLLNPDQVNQLSQLTTQVMARDNWVKVNQGILMSAAGSMVDKNTMFTGSRKDINVLAASLANQMWARSLNLGMVPDWGIILTESNKLALEGMGTLKIAGENLGKFSNVLASEEYKDVSARADAMIDGRPFPSHGIKFGPDVMIPESFQEDRQENQKRLEFTEQAGINNVLDANTMDGLQIVFGKTELDSSSPQVRADLFKDLLDYDPVENFDAITALITIDSLYRMGEATDNKTQQNYATRVKDSFVNAIESLGPGLATAAQDGSISPNAPFRKGRQVWDKGMFELWESNLANLTKEHESELKHLVISAQNMLKQQLNGR